MGWSRCGTDSKGRPIGYAFFATCDYSGCNQQIDRGLVYVCGDMHGEDEISCEKYFCESHMMNWVRPPGQEDRIVSICDDCYKLLSDSGEWEEDKDEGYLVQKEEGIV